MPNVYGRNLRAKCSPRPGPTFFSKPTTLHLPHHLLIVDRSLPLQPPKVRLHTSQHLPQIVNIQNSEVSRVSLWIVSEMDFVAVFDPYSRKLHKMPLEELDGMCLKYHPPYFLTQASVSKFNKCQLPRYQNWVDVYLLDRSVEPYNYFLVTNDEEALNAGEKHWIARVKLDQLGFVANFQRVYSSELSNHRTLYVGSIESHKGEGPPYYRAEFGMQPLQSR